MNKPNLIPFDLEKAKAGEPVYLSDGSPVRLLCFDRPGGFPIVAMSVSGIILIFDTRGISCSGYSGKNGYSNKLHHKEPEMWVNLYKENDNIYPEHKIYSSKASAQLNSYYGYRGTYKLVKE
jgi:hypothetical protein